MGKHLRQDQRLQLLGEMLAGEIDVAITASVMSEFFLDWIGRALNWSAQLEEAIGSRLVVDGLPLAANIQRAEAILRLSEKKIRP